MEPAESTDRAALVSALRRTLNHFYDPSVLRGSVLLELFNLSSSRNPTTALRRTLTDAIQSLKPDKSVPVDSNAWRVYRILYYRYIEQFTQREVAVDLSLSVRQLRRQETRALEVLADLLRARYDLADKLELLRASEPGEEQAKDPATAGASARERELERLVRSVPAESVSLPDLVEGILDTLAPLLRSSGVRITRHLPADLPLLTVQPITMRQALLNVIAAVVRRSAGGQVSIRAESEARQVCASIEASSPVDKRVAGDQPLENLDTVRQLVDISGGSLEVSAGEPLTVRLQLPAVEPVTILGVDDNSDTLRLWQRYLLGTRYHFIGTTEPQETLELVERWSPQVIVLDVMLPHIDGWELLARLREHPRTSAIPVIVCTILPQEDLAALLGAADLLRKPVTQQELLSALERQVSAPQPKECA